MSWSRCVSRPQDERFPCPEDGFAAHRPAAITAPGILEAGLIGEGVHTSHGCPPVDSPHLGESGRSEPLPGVLGVLAEKGSDLGQVEGSRGAVTWRGC